MQKINSLVPELIVSDLATSLRFYVETLGFQIEYQRPEEGFAFLSFHGSHLMLEQDGDEPSAWRVEPLERPFGRGMNLSIECPDVPLLLLALAHGGYALRQSEQERWYRRDEVFLGQLNFLVQDPDGYLLRFNQDLGRKPVPEV